MYKCILFKAGESIVLRALMIACLATALLAAVPPRFAKAQQDAEEDDFKSKNSPGKQTFTSVCAACHGLDGRGSDKAPGIIGNPKTHRRSDAELFRIVSEGKPGTGMPAFRSLTSAQVRSVVRYLRAMQGEFEVRKPPGDGERGKKIFAGACSSCHTVEGKGGFLGPELSSYGATRTAETIRDGILNRPRIAPFGYQAAVVTTLDGTRIEGALRNEDNFSLQLLTADGTFHFFQKSDVQRVEHLDQPLMPTNYSERMSPSEIDDLVSYLMTTGSPKAAHTPEVLGRHDAR